MNSGPLPTRIDWGTPCRLATSCRTCTTWSPVSRCPARIARLTRLMLSTRCQDAEALAGEELVGHEVHAPAFVQLRRSRPLVTNLATPVATGSFSPHLQPFFHVQPID